MRAKKKFLIECTKSGLFSDRTSYYYSEGTLEELIEYHGYTLECGQSYQHEKGNRKINVAPKTISSLITNLNNAVNNSASNGYAGKFYSVVTEKREN